MVINDNIVTDVMGMYPLNNIAQVAAMFWCKSQQIIIILSIFILFLTHYFSLSTQP